MRVCVVGAGAIGGLMAEAFAKSGHEVSLVARGEHLQGLREGGLRIRYPDAEPVYRLAATDEPAALGRQDLVVIALKAYSIGPMLARIAPLLGPETVVLPAINGLPWWYFARHPRYEGWRIECLDADGAMGRAIDARNIVGCVVHAAGEVIAPGVVQNTSGKRYILGELDGATTERLQAIAGALERGGSQVELTSAIRNAIWMKLIGNMSYNPVAALTLSRMNEINDDAGLLRCIRLQMLEAMAVAEHYGERITMSVDERIAVARLIGSSKISMHQDIERGRPLEIDAIVTSVLELARKAGIATPMIDAIHALIAARARHV